MKDTTGKTRIVSFMDDGRGHLVPDKKAGVQTLSEDGIQTKNDIEAINTMIGTYGSVGEVQKILGEDNAWMRKLSREPGTHTLKNDKGEDITYTVLTNKNEETQEETFA